MYFKHIISMSLSFIKQAPKRKHTKDYFSYANAYYKKREVQKTTGIIKTNLKQTNKEKIIMEHYK